MPRMTLVFAENVYTISIILSISREGLAPNGATLKFRVLDKDSSVNNVRINSSTSRVRVDIVGGQRQVTLTDSLLYMSCHVRYGADSNHAIGAIRKKNEKKTYANSPRAWMGLVSEHRNDSVGLNVSDLWKDLLCFVNQIKSL